MTASVDQGIPTDVEGTAIIDGKFCCTGCGNPLAAGVLYPSGQRKIVVPIFASEGDEKSDNYTTVYIDGLHCGHCESSTLFLLPRKAMKYSVGVENEKKSLHSD